jgi:hypothetical protein
MLQLDFFGQFDMKNFFVKNLSPNIADVNVVFSKVILKLVTKEWL